MKIEFTDINGNTLANNATLDIGMRNYIYLVLIVDGEGQATPIVGDIVKNNKKIGDFKWELGVGSYIEWYTGENRPTYVSNLDKIEAVVTSTPTSRVTLNIKRFQPAVGITASNGNFIQLVKPAVPNSKPREVVKDLIGKINIEIPATFSVSNSTNITTIKKYFGNTAELRDEPALIFGTSAAANTFLQSYVPPTLLDIFNTWARIDGDLYYAPGITPPPASAAAKWYWDDTKKSIVQPLNADYVTGFISNDVVDNYDLDFYVTSTNADDDWNGGIIAYVRQNNVNYTLLASVCCDGSNGASDPIAANITVDLQNPLSKKIATNDGDRVNGGWNGRKKRIRIVRRGDLITVNYSNWNSDIINPALEIVVDLNSKPELARFKGPKPYGYYSLSQPESTFYGIKYYGGVLRNTVIDAQTNKIYRFMVNSSTWVLLDGVTAQDVYGAPRVLVGEDGTRYNLKLDGTIVKS